VRIEFDYEAVRLQDDVVTATGRTLHAAVTPEGKPTRLPDRVKDLFR
jgi:acyl-CoA thioesterase FadM